jgi:arsenite methyltransferase
MFMEEQRVSSPVPLEELRAAIQEEYAAVAAHPEQGFHFHTGRRLAKILHYEDSWLNGIPESAIEAFAGTGNPFMLGRITEGERVVDVGSGAGIDSLIAAKMTGPGGRVVGVDMTPMMLERAQRAASDAEMENVVFEQAFAESIPIPDGWSDVVISNGVLNLVPDKDAALREMARIVRPGGRLQIGDILVEKAVPESAKADISLWTG